MDPLDIIKNLPEEVEEKPSRFKKIFLIIVSILILLLFLTYFLTNSNILYRIIGLSESSTIKDNVISINETNFAVFQGSTYRELIEYYNQNKEKEFKVCLSGIIDEGNYMINEVYKTEIISQTYTEVVSNPCPKDTIIDLHSHPYRSCLASDQDLKNLENNNIGQPWLIMAIMCEKQRFNFYL